MIHPRFFGRLLQINWVLVYHGLDELILATHLFRPVRFLAVLTPNYWLRRRRGPRGVRIRKALEDLGPIFVKFGQILSTRRDLLPEDIADELAKLQDRVPPFPSAAARASIEAEIGEPVARLFAAFDDTPLASASVAQVHAAALPDGQAVIVKVLRPGIEKRIEADVRVLYEVARLAQRFWREARRLRPHEVVAEFDKTITDELDLVREAANATELRRNFEHSEMLYVPRVHWPLTRRRVLVMERIHGIPISDIQRMREQNVDLKLLAERGVEIFFTQVFRDNFFHADMHPGNIFVTPDARYIAVDFGIVGSLTAVDQHYLAQNFIAFFNRNYRRVAELHIESGWVPKDARVTEIEGAIRTVCEPIFEKPLKEISYGQLLLRLFQAARRFDAEIQPQLVLFQKTLLNIEGLGRELYPELDLWQTAKPFLENWVREQVGVRAALKKLRDQLPEWSDRLPELPTLVHRVLHDAANGRLEVQWPAKDFEEIRQQIQRNHRRSIAAITGSALLISAFLLLGLDGYTMLMLGNAPALTWGLGGLGALLFASAWYSD